jgi:hypothetical protein
MTAPAIRCAARGFLLFFKPLNTGISCQKVPKSAKMCHFSPQNTVDLDDNK